MPFNQEKMIVKLIYLSSGRYMQTKLLSLFIFSCLFAFSQVTDDFSDNDFLNNPAWSGSLNDFIVNSNKEVQLNKSVA